MNAITTQASNNTAILDFNKGNGRWEATYNGQVILASQNKEYVIDKIVNQISNKVKAAGVTSYHDISDFTDEMRQAAMAGKVVETEDEALTFTIHERFDFLADFVEMVGNRKNASAIIVGSGGLGKSYTTYKTLDNACGLTRIETIDEAPVEAVEADEDVDAWEASRAAHRALVQSQDGTYKVIKGYSTAKGLYRTLYENRNRIVIFDDCDSVISGKDATSSEILKACLDSYDRRIVTWNAEASFGGDDLPRSFEFTGGVIFISNLSMDRVPQAIISRSFVADVSMTRDETVERMRVIAASDDFMPEFMKDQKDQALDFIAANIHRREIKEVNLRTLMMVVKLAAAGGNWERRALYLMINSR